MPNFLIIEKIFDK